MLTFPPDTTFLVQLVSFLLLWLVLRRLAWAPMLRVLEERDERTAGNRQLAARYRAEAEQVQQKYEAEFARARAELTAKMQSVRSVVAGEEQAIVAEARAAAQQRINQAREAFTQELKEARQAVVREAGYVGYLMARQVLGRDVPR